MKTLAITLHLSFVLSLSLTAIKLEQFEQDFRRCSHELYGTTVASPTSPSNLVWLDPVTGVGTIIAELSGNGIHKVTSIDFDSRGVLWGVGNDENEVSSLFVISCRSGRTYLVGPNNGAAGNITDIAFDDNDVLWGYTHAEGPNGIDSVGVIDLATGAFSPIGNTNLRDIGNGIAFDAFGDLIHVGKLAVSALDQTSGAAENIAPLLFHAPADNNPRINGLAKRNANGVLYGALNDKASGSTSPAENYLVTIDSYGQVSFVSSPAARAPDGLAGLAFNPSYEGCDDDN